MHPESERSPALNGFPGIRHGFFTRLGGVSRGIHMSLNCSFGAGDAFEDVRTNRALVAETLGGSCLITNRQVHGQSVRRVGKDTDAFGMEEADGLVTTDPGIAIGALGADCAPVLLAAPGVIGVAHAGWRGALYGITDEVIDKMESAGADRQRIAAAIGPAIQPMSYEVGEVFRERFLSSSTVPAEDCFRIHPDTGQVHFDLPRYIEKRLCHAGIMRLDRSTSDTYANEDRFYSYRRSCHRGESDYGRQIGAICLVRPV